MWDMKNKVCNSFGNFWYDGDTCPDCSVEISLDNARVYYINDVVGTGVNGIPNATKIIQIEWFPFQGLGWTAVLRMVFTTAV